MATRLGAEPSRRRTEAALTSATGSTRLAAHLPVPTDPEAFRAAVTVALEEFFASRRPVVDAVGPAYASVVDELEQFVLGGGKRVRPSFAWLGWLGAGGDPAAVPVLRVCAALELVQACALVHDDIIDSSATRRGHPTVHVAFAQRHREHRWSGDSHGFGDAVAILLGDLALSWADDMVRESGVDHRGAARLAPVWSAMRTEVLGGQLLDITGEVTGDESEQTALRIDRFKTAAYTIERPLHLGAALADADPDLIAAYRGFGTDIGIAFQLRDDLLGVFGDPAVTGKPSGDDLREGKHTVLVALALRAADATDPAAAKLLRDGLGTDLTDVEVETLRAAMLGLGAADEVERRIADLTDRGLRTLDASATAPDAKALLRDLALAATRRVT